MLLATLHSPSLHFHIGAWFVTALCTFIAFWINFLQRRNLLPNRINDILGPNAVVRLDYVAHVTGIIGFVGIIGSAYLGFIDAAGLENPSPFDIEAAIRGFDVAMGVPVLAFKVIWTVAGLQAFLFAGIIRLYFVTLKHSRSVYDQHVTIQIIYAESTLLGFLTMVIIAGAGGIWVYGSSILSGIPILQDFLPGGNLLPGVAALSGLLALTLIFSTILRESTAKRSTESEAKEKPVG
ncbi:MAG TPA: hypothetical protein VJ044_06545 [Candidatus Hodarchaeales archaeon]|nr:hypothetical protein [Candidatus Hodarchaeales archaeon]